MSVSNLPEWALKVKELYDQGAIDIEIIAEMNWDQATFDKYMENAAFKKLIENGRLRSKAFWISQSRKNLNNRQFNSQVHALYMKNIFGWAEKQENTENKSPDMMSSVELAETYHKIKGDLDKLQNNEVVGNVTALKAKARREVVTESSKK